VSRSQQMRRVIQRSLRKLGYNIYRLTDDERKAFARFESQATSQSMASVFGADLHRLTELRQRYASVKLPVAVHSVWASRKTSAAIADIGWGGVDLRNFRGHSAYVWDYGSFNFEVTNLKYYLFTQAVRQKDQLQLLTRLREDGAFGALSFEYEGVGRVSRDLLDSVVEINFLERHMGLMQREDISVLDIGAGYGRMAQRMLDAHPGIRAYTCVDAVPESTFLCEYHLKFRGLAERVQVIALDELEARLQPGGYNLALNIHSFSECTYAAIEWWLRKVAELGIPRLMIVPNDPDRFESMEPDRSRRDYAPLLQELGYQLVAREPVFDDPQVQALIGVRDHMYLFERRQA